MRTPAYPFLDLDANAMITAGDQRTWNGLLSKMDRLMFDGRGQLSIVHIGGSHVQADMWTMELRHRLQTVVPGVRAARGFIFPFNMARTNNPYWYHPEYTGRWTSVKNTVRNDACSTPSS